MTFLIDRLKDKIESKDSEESPERFDDLNYIIGNSSAMDVGEFPTPMDERIGYASMVGGSLMELQITNPATFELEGDAMIRTIDQLGLDITTHPDMNAGFCTAEISARGEEYGYETIEQYFTDYLQELAAFKKRVHREGKAGPLFNIGRINPHISTSPLPSLNERMANDVGVDPFGYEINKYNEQSIKKRNYRGENIYKNEKFLRKLYYTLFLELSNYPFEQYQQFASYSDKFDNQWNKARHLAAEDIFDEEAKTLEDKLGAVLTASRQDQGTGTTWLKFLEEWELENSIKKYKVVIGEREDEEGNTQAFIEELTKSEEKVENFKELLDGISRMNRTRLNQLDTDIYNIKNVDAEGLFEILVANLEDAVRAGISQREIIKNFDQTLDRSNLNNKIRAELELVLEEFWEAKDREDYLMSQEAKWAGLQSHLEVQQLRLLEAAYEVGKEELDKGIEELAADVFSGKDKDLFDVSGRANIDDEERMHEDLLERIFSGQQFQREMWKESIIFYHIIPAWMSKSSYDESDYHEGWDAPEFVWEAIVKEKWENEKDVDVNLDLTKPRNGIYDEGEDENVYHYLDLLEKSDEFRMDVAAAVGACYAWGHYTQRKVQFDLKGRDFGLDDEEEKEVENEGWTWIEWMNRFGLGVNLETMAGSPQMRFKIWRPKDISVVAHAI
ncbi:MAG: hypothetical protein V5A72_01250, partial [Candidatus Nanohaloarchaea archaeon]